MSIKENATIIRQEYVQKRPELKYSTWENVDALYANAINEIGRIIHFKGGDFNLSVLEHVLLINMFDKVVADHLDDDILLTYSKSDDDIARAKFLETQSASRAMGIYTGALSVLENQAGLTTFQSNGDMINTVLNRHYKNFVAGQTSQLLAA